MLLKPDRPSNLFMLLKPETRMASGRCTIMHTCMYRTTAVWAKSHLVPGGLSGCSRQMRTHKATDRSLTCDLISLTHSHWQTLPLTHAHTCVRTRARAHTHTHIHTHAHAHTHMESSRMNTSLHIPHSILRQQQQKQSTI